MNISISVGLPYDRNVRITRPKNPSNCDVSDVNGAMDNAQNGNSTKDVDNIDFSPSFENLYFSDSSSDGFSSKIADKDGNATVDKHSDGKKTESSANDDIIHGELIGKQTTACAKSPSNDLSFDVALLQKKDNGKFKKQS